MTTPGNSCTFPARVFVAHSRTRYLAPVRRGVDGRACKGGPFMTGTQVAWSAAALAILLGIVPAAAQTGAQDRCKDTLARQVFSNPEVKQDTLYWLARFSAEVAQQSDSPPDTPFAFDGITAAL